MPAVSALSQGCSAFLLRGWQLPRANGSAHAELVVSVPPWGIFASTTRPAPMDCFVAARLVMTLRDRTVAPRSDRRDVDDQRWHVIPVDRHRRGLPAGD